MFTRWFGSGVSDGTCECKKIKQNFFHKVGLECPHHFMILHDTTEPAIIELQSTILRSPHHLPNLWVKKLKEIKSAACKKFSFDNNI